MGLWKSSALPDRPALSKTNFRLQPDRKLFHIWTYNIQLPEGRRITYVYSVIALGSFSAIGLKEVKLNPEAEENRTLSQKNGTFTIQYQTTFKWLIQ